MGRIACLLGTVALSMLLGANGALAAKCEGSNARTYEAPVTLKKSADGAVTMFIQSTGTSFTRKGEAATLSPAWQHCNGFWTVNADKSGAGFGHCYAADSEGNQWVISWEGGNGGGTWQTVYGTGKYADAVGGKGTWTPGPKFAGGISTGTWEGDCPD